MAENNVSLAQNKLIILYLLESIQLPFSAARLQEFAIASDYMDYFQLVNYLDELLEIHYIEKLQENNLAYYLVTSEGSRALELLKEIMPEYVKRNIDEYVGINKKKIESELDVTADFYLSSENGYIVRCKLFEGANVLIEINLSVSDKKFANKICSHWKEDFGSIYRKILDILYEEDNDKKSKPE